MGKYSYPRFIFGIGLLLLGSCKLYQQKNREESLSSASEWQRDELVRQWQRSQQDSLSRYWLFWSDSSFRFHPDSGLLGHSGKLLLLESKVTAKAEKKLAAKVSEQHQQRLQKSTTDKRRTWTTPARWLIVLIGLSFVFIAAKFKKYFKAFWH